MEEKFPRPSPRSIWTPFCLNFFLQSHFISFSSDESLFVLIPAQWWLKFVFLQPHVFLISVIEGWWRSRSAFGDPQHSAVS